MSVGQPENEEFEEEPKKKNPAFGAKALKLDFGAMNKG